MSGFVRREACPACSARHHDVIFDAPYDGPPISDYLRRYYANRCDPATLAPASFTLAQCASCSLVFQVEVPGPEMSRTLYERWIASDETKGAAQERNLNIRRGYAFQIINVIKYFRANPTDVKMLDFGMGWGTWLEMARAFGCDVSGADFASESQAHAEGREIPVFNASDLPEGEFHFINAEQVFEHLAEPLATAERLRGALRPGGLLRICVPNGTDIRDRLRRGRWDDENRGSADSLMAVAPLEHVNCFNYRSLSGMARQAGLRETWFPARQFLDQWAPVRFVASSVMHKFRRPRGTLLLFEKV